MNPLDRVRLQKAAADCGFEMTATDRDEGLDLRSAHFPEIVHVRPAEGSWFELRASNALMLDEPSETGLELGSRVWGSLCCAEVSGSPCADDAEPCGRCLSLGDCRTCALDRG